MSRLNLTPDEEHKLLEVLERYYPMLRIEIVNTDDREFRRSLKEREAFMKELTESGMGNSIRMARLLVNVGKLVAEGKPVVGGPTSAQDLSLADKMFPNQGKS